MQVRLHTNSTAFPLPINTQLSRYANSCEITSKTNEISQVLRVHDNDEQHVVFDEGSEESALETQHDTELTAFFNANANCKEEAFIGVETLRYVDMPTKFTYNKKDKVWKKRAEGRKCDTLGRVDNVHPAAGDRFYLRMLLNSDHCKGKIGFDDLKTVPGETKACNTYQEACQKLGMLQDDHEWEMVLEEATSTRSCKNQVKIQRYVKHHSKTR